MQTAYYPQMNYKPDVNKWKLHASNLKYSRAKTLNFCTVSTFTCVFHDPSADHLSFVNKPP